jgi:nicotinate dehydrogenase subunit A
MTDEITSFELNVATVAVAAAPDAPLLYVLRNDLGCRGVRFGCGQGLCGACRVIIDGKAVNSCDVPLWQAAGKAVRTIESHETDTRLGILVDEIVKTQAGQCGYCLPGISMTALPLLERDMPPSRETIAAALCDNLCRCGAHTRIIGAIEAAGRRTGQAV